MVRIGVLGIDLDRLLGGLKCNTQACQPDVSARLIRFDRSRLNEQLPGKLVVFWREPVSSSVYSVARPTQPIDGCATFGDSLAGPRDKQQCRREIVMPTNELRKQLPQRHA